MKEIVRLAPGITLVTPSNTQIKQAITVAHRITMSPHEWEWTADEQFDMAAYVLWAHQRLSAIGQLVLGDLQ